MRSPSACIKTLITTDPHSGLLLHTHNEEGVDRLAARGQHVRLHGAELPKVLDQGYSAHLAQRRGRDWHRENRCQSDVWYVYIYTSIQGGLGAGSN